ncbi:MAG: PadR family transcriptional regulator [Propionibacteriaceae bacterium]|jgi:DNA-binding PadR family transcriptional regulator|nr:PadR family transcriptional regulator [Propionibacteriaceae bacterium]
MKTENLSEMLKGVLDGLVLEIISRGEIYGYEILRRLHSLGFSDIAEATVYSLLLRLERNRLVRVEKKPSDIGPQRKFYTLNARGENELAAFWARWDYLGERIEMLRKTEGVNHEVQR